ncbi:MAG: hypothetical protein ACRD8W_00905 [Nitrososphaeraceae archaeon]
MRKKLIEHNWEAIERESSNPTQAWHRVSKQCTTALDDLILLAQRIPESKQREIYSTKKIDQLLCSLLMMEENHSSSYSPSPRKIELAALLVERGINMNVFHYSRLEQDTPSLIGPTVNHLRQSVSMCNDISYKIRLKNAEAEAREIKHEYLFSWNNMLGKEKNRLIDFIKSKTANEPIQIIWTTFKRESREIQFDFVLGNELSKEIRELVFHIILNYTNPSADVNILDKIHGMIWEGNLLAKEAENYFSTTWTGDHFVRPNNDYNLYIRKK